MLQELFRIPGLNLPVYGYGLMLVLGVWAGVELGRYLFNRYGLRGDDFVAIGLLALAAGIVGARLSHILENLGQYTNPDRGLWGNLRAAVNLSEGGLTYYGGFLFATIVLIAYGRFRKLPIRFGMDVVAPCLMVGLALGRVGCLLNGCCWGQTCDPHQVPWAITFPYGSPPFNEQFQTGELGIGEGEHEVPYGLVGEVNIAGDGSVTPILIPKTEALADPELAPLVPHARSLPVHPSQLYTTVSALLITAICVAFLSLRPAPGRVFALMLLLEGPSRYVQETLRVEPAVFAGLSYSMWIALGITAAGVVLWFVFGQYAKSHPERPEQGHGFAVGPPVDPVPAGPSIATAS